MSCCVRGSSCIGSGEERLRCHATAHGMSDHDHRVSELPQEEEKVAQAGPRLTCPSSRPKVRGGIFVTGPEEGTERDADVPLFQSMLKE